MKKVDQRLIANETEDNFCCSFLAERAVLTVSRDGAARGRRREERCKALRVRESGARWPGHDGV